MKSLLIGAVIVGSPLFFWTPIHSSFDFSKLALSRTLILCLMVVVGFASKWVLAPAWRSKGAAIFFLCVGVLFVATIFSDTPVQSFYGSYQRQDGFLQWIFYAVFFAALLQHLDMGRIQKLIYAVCIGAAAISLYGLLQRFGMDPLFSDFDTAFFVRRIFSTLGNPDLLGQYLGMTLPLFLFGILGKTPVSHRILFGVGFLVCVAAMLFSQSRAPILGLIAAMGIFFLWLIRAKKISLKRVILIGVAALVALSILFASPLKTHIPLLNRFSGSEGNVRSIESRFIIWTAAVRMIQAHPVIGLGLDVFNIHFPAYADPKFFEVEWDLNTFADRAHNDLLEWGVRAGVPGMLSYAALFIWIFFAYLRSAKKSAAFSLEQGVWLGIFVFFFQNMVAFSESSHIFLMLFYVACIAVFVAKQQKLSRPVLLKAYAAKVPRWVRIVVPAVCVIFVVPIWYKTVFVPVKAELRYTDSLALESESYDNSVAALKEATALNPYVAFYWYELLMKDASSLPRSVFYLEQVEGQTMHLILWKGVLYSHEDMTKAASFFRQAIELNSRYPHAYLAYADALYRDKNYPAAAEQYENFLAFAPPFWKWKFDLKERSIFQQTAYRIFFSSNWSFNGILERLSNCYEVIGDTSKALFYKRFT